MGVVLCPANVHDSRALVEAVDAVVPVRGKRGAARKRPHTLHADKGYNSKANRQELYQRGIVPRLARRSIENSQKLGRHRWVVERTFAWLNHFRRLRVRYERWADIHLAFLLLGCALICFRSL